MIIEIFVLALASTVRPTSLAAVYALCSSESRRGLMIAYVAAGLAFTLAFGGIIVGATDGIHVGSGDDTAKGIADMAGGALALLFGLGLVTGVVSRRQTDDAPSSTGRVKSLLNDRLTVRTAALAGPLTHIPGLFYLIALNAIVAHDASTPAKILALLIFNAVWFAVPLAALVACMVSPGKAQALVGWIERWAREHARAILLTASFGVGAALVIRGLLAV